MTTYIDPRGPYVLESVANADSRAKHPEGMVNHWAATLKVSPGGKFCYVDWTTTHIKILHLPHRGEGEPRPAQ